MQKHFKYFYLKWLTGNSTNFLLLHLKMPTTSSNIFWASSQHVAAKLPVLFPYRTKHESALLYVHIHFAAFVFKQALQRWHRRVSSAYSKSQSAHSEQHKSWKEVNCSLRLIALCCRQSARHKYIRHHEQWQIVRGWHEQQQSTLSVHGSLSPPRIICVCSYATKGKLFSTFLTHHPIQTVRFVRDLFPRDDDLMGGKVFLSEMRYRFSFGRQQ